MKEEFKEPTFSIEQVEMEEIVTSSGTFGKAYGDDETWNLFGDAA